MSFFNQDPEALLRAMQNRLTSDIEQSQAALAELAAIAATLATEQARLREEAKEFRELMNAPAIPYGPGFTANAASSRRIYIALRARYLMDRTEAALKAGQNEDAARLANDLQAECAKLAAALQAGPAEPPPAFGALPPAQ